MIAVEQIKRSQGLQELFAGIVGVSNSVAVTGVAIDSRQVKPGDLFMAYKGTTHNGADFIDAAISAGAVALAIDANGQQLNKLPGSVPVIRVKDLRKQIGIIASRFLGEPSKILNIIGVTGTNGKTTTSLLIAHALCQCQRETASIGTLGYGKTGTMEASSVTTPDPVRLHTLFASWCDKLDSVVMEVSSHALDQARVAGVAFNTAVYTNLSRDHLDYHKTMESYAAAKTQLFNTPGLEHGVINYDDKYGRQLLSSCKLIPELIAYTANPESAGEIGGNVVIGNVINRDNLHKKISVSSPWGAAQITTRLLGEFNVSNILAAFSVLCLSGIPAEQAAAAISSFRGVPGRMECFAATNKPLLVVDYAHTPAALEQVLQSLRPYCKGKLYCVFGCGGDRDSGKRPQMGAIAETCADVVVLTNDNPRTEKPERIVSQILTGMQNKERVAVRYDRSDAIANTYLQAGVSDVMLIAGKGHETTQTIGHKVLPFSDRDLARCLTEDKA